MADEQQAVCGSAACISGSADTTFGSNGTGTVTDVGSAGGTTGPGGTLDDQASRVVLDSQGRLVLAGRSNDATGIRHAAVWRLNSDGSPDTSFNGTGSIFLPLAIAGGPDVVNGLSLDSSGNILVTGETGGNTMVLWRLTDAGVLDPAFASGAGLVTNNGSCPNTVFDTGNTVASDSLNGIIVAGECDSTSLNGPYSVLYHYLQNGTPDTSFSDGSCLVAGAVGGCRLVSHIGPLVEYNGGNAVLVDSSQRILVLGSSTDNNTRNFVVVWRDSSNGSRDSAFGPGGVGYSAIGTHALAANSQDFSNGFVFDAAGRIVIAGTSAPGSGGQSRCTWCSGA